MPTPLPARRMLDQARPLIRRRIAQGHLQREAVKGCGTALSPRPIGLVPDLHAIPRPDRLWETAATRPHESSFRDARRWFELSIHPDHPPRGRAYESFLRLLSGAHGGFVFEVAGNRERVSVRIGVNAIDIPVLETACRALHLGLGRDRCRAATLPRSPPRVYGFAPRPPYADAFTRLDELPHPPVGLLTKVLHMLPPEQVGIYQVCAAPVTDDGWAQNVRALQDDRFRMLLEPGGPTGPPSQSWTMQLPSGSLNHLTQEINGKAHPDRARFFALSRVAVWPDRFGDARSAAAWLKALAAPVGLILQNGRGFDPIPPQAFDAVVGPERLADMLEYGHVYRHGVLLNSEELAAWVHLPELAIVEDLRLHHLRCEPLIPSVTPGRGTRIGHCIDGDRRVQAVVPPHVRSRHTCIVGRNGTGKSTLLQSMCLDDVARGEGALIIDPHGTLVREIADRLPDEAADRTWWLDFEDPEYAVLFNPLRAGVTPDGGSDPLGSGSGASPDHPPHSTTNIEPPRQIASRIADHFIGAFGAMTAGWGDRLEHILRHLLIAAIQMPGGGLVDVTAALERSGKRGQRVRQRMLEHCSDVIVRQFLEEMGKSYANADVNPVHHKLSKLLLSGPASLSLRQPENRLHVSDWISRGDIVLVDLGKTSGDFKHLLGSLLIAAAYTAALARPVIPGERPQPFHVVIDEAHRFAAPLMTSMVAETRKFGVGLTLAFQYLKQFPDDAIHAFGTVDTSIVFSVDSGDAQTLAKGFQGRVEPQQITALEDFEAYARVGGRPLHLHTPHFTDLPEGAGRYEEIRRRSFERWYAPRRRLEAQTNQRLLGHEGPEQSGPVIQPQSPPEEVLRDDPDWPR